jgi:hypothetical protein
MRVKSVIFVFVFSVLLIGFFSIGNVKALDFADWNPTWFKIKVSETGKAGFVVPPGGDVVTNNEKTTENFLAVKDYTNSAFVVWYCTFNGSVWDYQEELWPILGGEPTEFLTLFTFNYQQSQNVLQTYWIPLHVKGKENSSSVGEIKSASFKNLGGIFREQIGTPIVTQQGTGTVKFSGSLITRDKVLSDVPEGCRITRP